MDGTSLDQAANGFNTPIIEYADSMGRTVQSEQFNVDQNEKNATFVEYDILGDVLSALSFYSLK